MTDAQLPCSDSAFGGSLFGAAHESDLWRRTKGTVDDDICKCHASPKPCSHSFQDSFLRGKLARQPLNPAGSISYLVEFFLDKTAGDQRIAGVLHPAFHLGDVDQINPMSDYVHIRHRFPLMLPAGRRALQSNNELS